jgi:hypothetical protein
MRRRFDDWVFLWNSVGSVRDKNVLAHRKHRNAQNGIL